jgi:prepilin signal peptidase PulO-like enzyme (type II secretory pathway)
VFVFPPLLTAAKPLLVHVAPGMPPDYWWVTGGVLAILAMTATIDAFTAYIPDLMIFLGLFAVTSTQGFFVSWDVAAYHFTQAVMAGLLIWGINFAWYDVMRYDALGMGDAKWTMLAVACFGVEPAIVAWGVGAIFAVGFISMAYLAYYKLGRVTFAPFLFMGLCAGLYWIRFMG